MDNQVSFTNFKCRAHPDGDGFLSACDFPRIGRDQPGIRLFTLVAIHNFLSKDPVIVTQTVAHRRDFLGRERIHEARCQAAEATIPQPGIRFLFDQLGHLQSFSLFEIFRRQSELEVCEIVNQRPTYQKLHRKVIDLLRVRPVVHAACLQPALRKHISQGARQRFEPLTRCGFSRINHMVEGQPPLEDGILRTIKSQRCAPVACEQFLPVVNFHGGYSCLCK